MNRHITLKPEQINFPGDLGNYDCFIVHSVDEFKVYNRDAFMEKYKDLRQIINLYCFNRKEELRFNRQNWVRIIETDERGEGNTFEVQLKEEKQYTVAEKEGDGKFPITVFKYYLEPERKTDTGSDKMWVVPDIPIIYRHSIKV